MPLPHIPGHEFAGVIARVGAEVTAFAVGDRVTVPFVNGCGRCVWCASNQAQVCPQQTQPGFTHPSSFAEQVAVRSADFNLVRLPAEIDFVTAASLGCRLATAYHALTAQGRLQAGEWLAVLGCRRGGPFRRHGRRCCTELGIMLIELSALTRLPVARWLLLGYVLLVIVATYTLGFPELLGLVLLGGLALMVVGWVRRRWWLVGVGLAAVALSLFVPSDVATAYVVTEMR